MEIVNYPHPALRWKSQPVQQIDARLRSIVQEMFELMYAARGVGLAANQVALPYRLFVVNPTADPEEKDAEFVFINPEVTSRRGTDEDEEGCLSLPNLYGPVRRAEEIVIDGFDLQGRGFELELDDLPARIVQHEYDHIEGVMFPDRMTDIGRMEIQPQLDELEIAFRRRQKSGEIPSDDELVRQLRELEGR